MLLATVKAPPPIWNSKLPHLLKTLKFQIVVMALLTGVLSALATAQLVLATTQASIERQLLLRESSETESTAALLASNLDTLQSTLSAVARQAPPVLWQDAARLSRHLRDKPALHALFDSVVAVNAGGDMLVRLTKGVPSQVLANVADRAYFRQALKTDQPVVSEPLLSRVDRTPLVAIAMAVAGPDGQPVGVLAGSLGLGSSRLFSALAGAERQDGSRSIVIDRRGVLLSHPDARRVLGLAREEPAVADFFDRWHAVGSPINTEGTAEFHGANLVSSAGIAGSDWVLLRLIPQALAMEPVVAAQRTAWMSAAGVGAASALVAGAMAWLLVRPISRLRARAALLVARQDGDGSVPWPVLHGELGELAETFQAVDDQRQNKQRETEALLLKLEAVLDHADVGIGLTRDGHFELVSHRFCSIFGWEKSDLLQQATRVIYASDEAFAALVERARPAFTTSGAFDGELELVRRSGEPFWAHMRGHAVVPGDMSQGTIWTIEDVTQARAQRERLTWASSHDGLTGLANRAAFTELLEKQARLSQTNPFCLLCIDLDGFKQVNDTGGHAAGDALLRELAHRFEAQVRKADSVARLGGDEFAVLLGQCPLDHGRQIAEKMRAAAEEFRLAWAGDLFGVSTSIGLVLVDGAYASAADAMAAADAACYLAKKAGRNRVVAGGQ